MTESRLRGQETSLLPLDSPTARVLLPRPGFRGRVGTPEGTEESPVRHPWGVRRGNRHRRCPLGKVRVAFSFFGVLFSTHFDRYVFSFRLSGFIELCVPFDSLLLHKRRVLFSLKGLKISRRCVVIPLSTVELCVPVPVCAVSLALPSPKRCRTVFGSTRVGRGAVEPFVSSDYEGYDYCLTPCPSPSLSFDHGGKASCRTVCRFK